MHAGPVPIVLVPRVAANVSLTGDDVPGVTATALQTVTGTVRLTYAGRTWRHTAHLARVTDHSLDDSQPAGTGDGDVSHRNDHSHGDVPRRRARRPARPAH